MSINGTASSVQSSSSAADKIAQIQKDRAKRKQGIAEKQLDQEAVDEAALNALEIEHGDGSVAKMKPGGYVAGLPTFMVVKSPGGTSFYNRYKTMVRVAGKNAQAIGAAQEMLGEACIVYPADEETRKAYFAAFPGASVSAGIRAVAFVELEAEDEKKG